MHICHITCSLICITIGTNTLITSLLLTARLACRYICRSSCFLREALIKQDNVNWEMFWQHRSSSTIQNSFAANNISAVKVSYIWLNLHCLAIIYVHIFITNHLPRACVCVCVRVCVCVCTHRLASQHCICTGSSIVFCRWQVISDERYLKVLTTHLAHNISQCYKVHSQKYISVHWPVLFPATFEITITVERSMRHTGGQSTQCISHMYTVWCPVLVRTSCRFLHMKCI